MARVGTRGAGLSKDIALSVKNKLTHLGANVSDDLARLSGKVEDAFAYADGAVSKNIGKHNARVYQSNGGNWDEVASGILGGSGAGRKAAAEFSDDASQALAKHGDEVSRALKETDEQAGKHASAEFGGETSEALAKHGDEVSQALKETGEQADKHPNAEFGGGSVSRKIESEVSSGNGRSVYGPYYDEAVKRHAEKPDWYADPDESKIISGEELSDARLEYQQMVRRGELEPGHHRQGLAFGGENTPENIQFTGESTIRKSKLDGIDTSFYHENGYGKKDAKILKIHKNENGLYVFGNNPNHTEVTNFQNKVLRWQKNEGLR